MRRFLALASAYLLAIGPVFFFAGSSAYAGSRDTTVLVYWELPFGVGKQSEPSFGLRVDRDMYARDQVFGSSVDRDMFAGYRDGSDEIVLHAFDMQFRDDGLHAARVFGLNLAPTLFGLSAGEDGDQLASVLVGDDQMEDQQQQLCAYQMAFFCYGFGALLLGGASYGFYVWVVDESGGEPGANDREPDQNSRE